MAYRELWLPTRKRILEEHCSIEYVYSQPTKLLQHTAVLQIHSTDTEQESWYE